MIWAVIVLSAIILLLIFMDVSESMKASRNLSLRIDGIQERIDGLRDMLMQKIENDYQQLKKDIRK